MSKQNRLMTVHMTFLVYALELNPILYLPVCFKLCTRTQHMQANFKVVKQVIYLFFVVHSFPTR